MKNLFNFFQFSQVYFQINYLVNFFTGRKLSALNTVDMNRKFVCAWILIFALKLMIFLSSRNFWSNLIQQIWLCPVVISNNILIDKHENSTLGPEYDLPSALVKYLSQHRFEFVNRRQARCWFIVPSLNLISCLQFTQ